MKLLKMEMRKIMARPVLNLGFLVILGFLVFVILQNAIEEHTEIDGKVYHGLEAIEKDQELAKKYEGMLTMEKAEEIVRNYGFSGYNEVETFREGNYCSQFITDYMTDFLQTGKTPTDFYQGTDFLNNASYLVDGTVEFGYIQGWVLFKKYLSLLNRTMCLYMILLIASVFSEEYSLKTVNVLLTAEHGKKKGIWSKIGASLLCGTIIYAGAVLVILLAILGCYGTEGLGAGARLISWQGSGQTVFLSLAKSVLIGLAGNLLNVCITLFISARCSQSVKAVTAGVIIYFMPYVIWSFVINGDLSDLIMNTYIGRIIGKIAGILCNGMPYYFCLLPDIGIPGNITGWIYLTVLALAAGGIVLAYKNYRDYQALS